MSINVFQGDNADVAQISTHTVVDTWATNDIANLICGGKTVTFIVGATQTPAAVVAGLVAAWNTSEDGALEEVTATDAAPAITLTADGQGIPFVTTATETTAGDGTIGAQVDTTAVDGAENWDRDTNWDTAAVPVDGDNVHIESTDNSIKHGLAQSAVTLASLDIKQSFIGQLGKPRENTDNANAFVDYRPTYLAISATICTIGEGDGDGSGRIKHDAGSNVCDWTVLGSGTRLSDTSDVPAVLLKGTHASNTLTVQRGDVGVAFFAGEVSTIATLNVGHKTSETADSQVICGAGVTITTINQTGGTLDIDLTTAGVVTINLDGGVLTLRGDVGGVTTINIAAGAKLIDMGGSGTIATLELSGEYDHSQSTTPRAITNRNLHPGHTYRDPHGVVSVGGNGIDFHNCGPGQRGTFETAANRTWTESAI
jgi:hypothetical protein